MVLPHVYSTSKIMTGPPSHADIIICWSNNSHIVLSGGECLTKKIKYSPDSWNYDKYDNKIKTIYEELITYNTPVTCGKSQEQYYVVGISDDCMISVSNASMVQLLQKIISDTWYILQDNKTIFKSSGQRIWDATFTNIIILTFILIVILSCIFIVLLL